MFFSDRKKKKKNAEWRGRVTLKILVCLFWFLLLLKGVVGGAAQPMGLIRKSHLDPEVFPIS